MAAISQVEEKLGDKGGGGRPQTKRARAGESPKNPAPQGNLDFTGADDQNRTGDLLITNQLLYRLSYIGIHWKSIFH